MLDNLASSLLTVCVSLLFTAFVYVKMNPKVVISIFNLYSNFKLNLKKKVITTTSSFKLCYLERGSMTSDKPSLLMIHGYMSNKNDYSIMMEHFPQDEYHLISLDLPGHGDSKEKDGEKLNTMMFVRAINEFVEAVGLNKKKFHLIGASMGGQIAGVYASMHPEQLISLSLCCPYGIQFTNKEENLKAGMANPPITKKRMKEILKELAYKEIPIPDLVLSGMLQIRKSKQDFADRLARMLLSSEDFNLLEEHIHKIQTPLFIIWGKEDKLLPVQCVDVMLEKLPRPPKKLVILEEVGHIIFLERPRKTSFIIQEFIKSFSEC